MVAAALGGAGGLLDQVAQVELGGGAAAGQARAHLAGRVVELPLAVAAAVEVVAVDAAYGACMVHSGVTPTLAKLSI